MDIVIILVWFCQTVAFPGPGGAVAPAPSGYTYTRTITIDHTKAGSSTSYNFPLMISGSYSYLRTVGNGGQVQSSSGYDVAFSSVSGCSSSLLKWEQELWSQTTGQVVYWVSVPALSSSTDTVIYMCYGNPAVSSFQGGASSAVWLTAGYSYVYHLNELSNATAIDSSGALNSSSNLSTQTAGLIGYGQNFSSSSSQGITFPDMPAARGVTQISISGWQQRSFSSANAGFGLSNSTATTAFEPLLYGYTNGYGIASNASGVSSSYNNSLAFAGTGWIHTALIFDGTQSTNDGRLKFYVNGQLQIPPSYFGTIPASMYSGTLPGVIGVFSSGPGYTTCDCSQDEVRYAAGIILRADWILAEYNNQSSPATFYSGL